MTGGRGIPVEDLAAELEGTCSICHQPECPQSIGGSRGLPGAIPARLENGQAQSRGYGEWIVHPLEAMFLLHRGYAIVDGVRQPVQFLFNEAWVTQVRVEGTFLQQRPHDRFVDCALTGERLLISVSDPLSDKQTESAAA